MRSQFFFIFTALFLAVNAVPAKKHFFLGRAKGFDVNLVRVPVSPVGVGTRNSAPISALRTTTSESNTMMFTPAANRISAHPYNDYKLPAATGPPSGTGGCVSCSVDNFNLVNEYRASKGLSQLSWSNTFSYLAEKWSKHMFDTKVFVHSCYPFWENIASDYNGHNWNTAADAFFETWKNSADQNENMALTTHKCMGVGIYGNGTLLYATQIFSNDCP